MLFDVDASPAFTSWAFGCDVALTADAHIDGGRLLGVYDGGVHVVPRAEGDATVHSSSLLHGVTRMHSGVRYSMIMFYSPLVAGA